MAKYIVVHTYKKSPEEVWKVFSDMGPEMARSMAAGETPARCLKTWNPFPYGRTDRLVCLWEGDKPEQVEASLTSLAEYVTSDIMQVDEIDWAELAKPGGMSVPTQVPTRI